MLIEHRIAVGIGRHAAKNIRRVAQGLGRVLKRTAAVEDEGLDAGGGQGVGTLRATGRSGDAPAAGLQPFGQHACGISQAEAEQSGCDHSRGL